MAQSRAQGAIRPTRQGVTLCYIDGFDGGRTRARTLDPLIKSQLLYQLSYAPIDPAFVPEAAK
jgi:hypothetical protein